LCKEFDAMLIKRTRGWEISESRATPESAFFNRRNMLIGSGVPLAAGALGGCGGQEKTVAQAPTPTPAAAPPAPPAPAADAGPALYPAARNAKYVSDRPVTAENITTNYNNFYEYGTDKNVARNATALLKTRPWDIKIDGLVEKPFTIGLDDLVRKVTLEERVYRHRCVE